MSTKSERSERTPRLVPDAIAEREENSEGRRRLSNHVDDVPLETVDRRKICSSRGKRRAKFGDEISLRYFNSFLNDSRDSPIVTRRRRSIQFETISMRSISCGPNYSSPLVLTTRIIARGENSFSPQF